MIPRSYRSTSSRLRALTLAVLLPSIFGVLPSALAKSPDAKPSVPIEGFRCPSCANVRDCQLPNPKDRKTFIQCTPDGRAYVMPCAPGTEWNDKIKVCDWPPSATPPKKKKG